MRKLSLGLVALLATVLVAASLGFATRSAQGATPVLTGLVGPGFNISLKKAGKTVKTLKPGKYIIKVSDKSNIHNFHLKGPRVNKTTSVVKVYKVTWTVTLKKGKYTFVCDPHAEFMKGTFVVK